MSDADWVMGVVRESWESCRGVRAADLTDGQKFVVAVCAGVPLLATGMCTAPCRIGDCDEGGYVVAWLDGKADAGVYGRERHEVTIRHRAVADVAVAPPHTCLYCGCALTGEATVCGGCTHDHV